MSCKSIAPLLALYMDDALTPVEARQVEEHLPTCPACSALLQALRHDRAALQALPTVLPPVGLSATVLQQVAARRLRKRSVVRYLVPRLSSLAAAIVLVFLTSNLYLFPGLWPEQPPMDESLPRMMMLPAGSEQKTPDNQLAANGLEAPAGSEKQEPGVEKFAITSEATVGERSTAMQMSDWHAGNSYGEQPLADSRSAYWLWSGLAGAGLFGLGSWFFVFRSRRI